MKLGLFLFGWMTWILLLVLVLFAAVSLSSVTLWIVFGILILQTLVYLEIRTWGE